MESVSIREYSRLLAFLSLYLYDLNRDGIADIGSFSWYNDIVQFDSEGILPAIPENIKREVFGFAWEIVSGTLSNLERIDTQIREFLVNWEFNRLLPVDRAILRLGAYSLIYRHDIPCEVTIYECNELAMEFSEENSYRYINGILHNIKLRFRRNFLMDRIAPGGNSKKKLFKIKRTGKP
ncbi:MAG: transcription antitermination factor NusB [Spirochaetes bacterium GWF1_51_8]|nr:MAG: transcription antitermination factor NusB [Spirochaetes bacterium GWF1_51_8]